MCSLIFLFLGWLFVPVAILGAATPPIMIEEAVTAASAEVIAQDATPISLGETVTGALTADQTEAFYSFTGELGQSVVIDLVSTDFDSYLRLRDPDGFEIATDDDSGGNLNARIGPLALPANGTYTIVATRFGSGIGSYTLSLNPITLRSLSYGDSIAGELTDDELSLLYRFRGQAGDVVVIAMNSDDFDSYLQLREEGWSYDLISDDDSGGSLNALIGPFRLPNDGNYHIIARSLSQTATGRFTLSLNTTSLTTLAFDEPVTVTLEAGEDAYFDFEASTGQVINIEVDSGDTIDTLAILRGPYGYEVIRNDDSGGRVDPAIINYPITQDGVYILVVRSLVLAESDDEAPPELESEAEATEVFVEISEVTVTLSESALVSLDDGPQNLSFSDKQQRDFVTFSASAGDKVRITLAVVRGQPVSPTISMSQGGSSLGYNGLNNIDEVSFVTTIPNDGTVTITVEEYSYRAAVIRVSLERLGDE